jgi:lipopolysaccharide export system protein LptA
MRLHPSIFVAALALLAIVLAARPALAQEESVVIEADQIVYDQAAQRIEATGNVRIRHRGVTVRADRAVMDLRTERLQATGNVVLTDDQGRTMRGQTLIYDFRARRAELSPAATTIDGVNVRSERIIAEPARILGEGATFTTCDPDQPAYRITATQIEVIPGERLVAHRASLWLGSVRLFTLPQMTVSLRSGEATARSFPTAGYSPGDGLWVEYGWETPLGQGTGRIFGRLGTLSAQAGLQLLKYPIGSSGVVLSAALQGGWLLRRGWGSPLISRVRYQVALDLPAIKLTPSLTWRAGLSWRDSFYGTGQRQSIARAESALAYHLDANSQLQVRVVLTSLRGRSPFRVEDVDTRRAPNHLAAQYVRRDAIGGGVETNWRTGVVFHLSNGTTSLLAEYGRKAGDRYHWSIGTQYNLVTHTMRLFTDSGIALTPRTYITVQADYSVTRARFKDLDLLVRTNICDCIGLAFRYRVIRREFWLEVGLLPPAPVPTTEP